MDTQVMNMDGHGQQKSYACRSLGYTITTVPNIKTSTETDTLASEQMNQAKGAQRLLLKNKKKRRNGIEKGKF